MGVVGRRPWGAGSGCQARSWALSWSDGEPPSGLWSEDRCGQPHVGQVVWGGAGGREARRLSQSRPTPHPAGFLQLCPEGPHLPPSHSPINSVKPVEGLGNDCGAGVGSAQGHPFLPLSF